MEPMRGEYPLETLCRVLDVSGSGFHASRRRGASRRVQEELQLELAAHGARVGVHRIKGIRRGNAEDRVDLSSPFGSTRHRAIREITECIEVFCNRQQRI
jgi:hypothetical protein